MLSRVADEDSVVTEETEVTASEESERSLLRIGQLAALCRKTVRALHLYEEMGLLIPVHRTKGGFRLYQRGAVERVKWIGRLQEADLSLGEIREFLQDISGESIAQKTMERLRQLLQAKLVEVQGQIQKLQMLHEDFQEGLSYLDTCRTCDEKNESRCQQNCQKRAEPQTAPLMVAGFYHHSAHRITGGKHVDGR